MACWFYLPWNDGCRHGGFRVAEAVSVGFRVWFAGDLGVAVRLAVVGGIVLVEGVSTGILKDMTGLRGERRVVVMQGARESESCSITVEYRLGIEC